MERNYTPEEQKEHRRLWVEALRSGKYQQTSGCLHDAEGFCCLGVACDVSGLGAWGSEWAASYEVGDDTDDTMLPPPVRKWLGLTSNSGIVDNARTLWGLNDDGKTFAEIADIIEAEPKGLIEAA